MDNKHLLTRRKGNKKFCFPKTLNNEVEGKQNSLFPVGPVIKSFVIPPNSKIEKSGKKILACGLSAQQTCLGFKMHNLITCEPKVQGVVSLGS